ncbi:hypothetical protein MRB53_038820 [Persea americana]|nr:hypothetical protein MRB53_038820 [Persea americana]
MRCSTRSRTTDMDPSRLPLEIFILIFQYLPPINTWQYRIISRSWYESLSSAIAVTSALKDRLDLEHFKNHHLSRPISLVSIAPERPYRWFQLAYHHECLAYFRYPTKSDESTGFTKEGDIRVREMVGEVNGPIEIHNSIIAMLPDLGGMDDFFRQLQLEPGDDLPEVLYIYDYAKDIFEIQQLSAIRPPWSRIRGLLMSADDILIITIDSADYRRDPVQSRISVRSLNGRNWSAEYSVPAKSHWCWHWSLSHLSSRFNGISYDISVPGEKAYIITITLDGFLACQDYLTARWYNDVYKVVEFGIESKSGFICHDIPFNMHYSRRSSTLQVSERYMVLTEQLHNSAYPSFNGIVGIHVFRFGASLDFFFNSIAQALHQSHKSISASTKLDLEASTCIKTRLRNGNKMKRSQICDMRSRCIC